MNQLQEAAANVLTAYKNDKDLGKVIFELSKAWYNDLGSWNKPSLKTTKEQLVNLLIWQELPSNIKCELLVDVIRQIRKALSITEAACLGCDLTFPEDEVECPSCGAVRVADLEERCVPPDNAPQTTISGGVRPEQGDDNE